MPKKATGSRSAYYLRGDTIIDESFTEDQLAEFREPGYTYRAEDFETSNTNVQRFFAIAGNGRYHELTPSNASELISILSAGYRFILPVPLDKLKDYLIEVAMTKGELALRFIEHRKREIAFKSPRLGATPDCEFKYLFITESDSKNSKEQ